MFHTLGYKGHYIHITVGSKHPESPCYGLEDEIKASIIHDDGGFTNIKCKSVIGAKQVISKYVNKSN